MMAALQNGLLRRFIDSLWRGSETARSAGARGRPGEALALARALVNHTPDAGLVKLAQALAQAYRQMDDGEALAFFRGLVREFPADSQALSAAASAYIAWPDPKREAELHKASEPLRQELIRRLNTAPGGTALIVGMRRRVLELKAQDRDLAPLAADLHHLLASWFNRGFLQARQITWDTPAAILEKLIQYEAVHAIRDWSDLKHRVEGDRRCFGFFHPSMPGEPLIFVEIALTKAISSSIAPLLERDSVRGAIRSPTTAIFYSISNCQPGLRNIQFGDFLIKQVVADLKAEIPSLSVFSTLSPIPGFRAWLAAAMEAGLLVRPGLRRRLESQDWTTDDGLVEVLRAPLSGLCARYLLGMTPDGRPGPIVDPVARFHLANGARVERINWRADLSTKGLQQSLGLMVNYRYLPQAIDANQEAFAFEGRVQKSREVAALFKAPVRLADPVQSRDLVTTQTS